MKGNWIKNLLNCLLIKIVAKPRSTKLEVLWSYENSMKRQWLRLSHYLLECRICTRRYTVRLRCFVYLRNGNVPTVLFFKQNFRSSFLSLFTSSSNLYSTRINIHRMGTVLVHGVLCTQTAAKQIVMTVNSPHHLPVLIGHCGSVCFYFPFIIHIRLSFVWHHSLFK